MNATLKRKSGVTAMRTSKAPAEAQAIAYQGKVYVRTEDKDGNGYPVFREGQLVWELKDGL